MAEAGAKMTPRLLARLKEQGLKEIRVSPEELIGRYAALDVINEKTGEIYVEAGQEITQAVLDLFDENGIDVLPTLAIDHVNVGPYIRNTLAADKNSNREEALLDIYRVMRPGEPPTLEQAETLFQGLLFDIDRYDLSPVGRVKMNMRLGFEGVPDSQRTLRREDILAVVKVLHDLKDGRGEIDDIDHLGNRRVRSVGELMENQYRVGLLRMERAIRERMSSIDIDTVMPHDLINAKPAAAAVREFFGSSQLSQFMDQTNPLSEVTHKRRLSALGTGRPHARARRLRGARRASDALRPHLPDRDAGRPEHRPDQLARDLRPRQPVRLHREPLPQGRARPASPTRSSTCRRWRRAATRWPRPMPRSTRAAASSPTWCSAARAASTSSARPDTIDFVDVSPKQIVSVAAALIPFLENDDANRALMGSNMQRQAVPLIQAEAPLVGTGMEEVVARDSGVAIAARRTGIVDQVDAMRIVVRATEDVGPNRPAVDIYNLLKFQRSNQSTCITQKPLVKVGDQVKKGDIVADGPSTRDGELALGRNVLVAFMPWNGYNFEDSILLSERIVRDDVFTSIHIEEFEVMARDTKLGQEEISRDIPNVGEEALKNLDEAGIVYIGAEVKAGDILVGKVTPKGESPMTPEEKLLRAIFGEKAADVRDTSLKVPPGVEGTVVEVRVFNRRGVDKDERALAIERDEIERLAKDRDDEKAILERSFYSQIQEMLLNQTVAGGLKGLKPGTRITDKVLGEYTPGQWRQIAVKTDKRQAEIEALEQAVRRVDEAPAGPLRQQGRQAAARRRAAAGRDEDGQGLRRHQAQAAAGRQDGRPPRQQGRDLAHHAARGHAVPRGRHAGRHRAEPARRALAA